MDALVRKRRLLLLAGVLVACAFIGGSAATARPAARLTGSWIGTYRIGNGAVPMTIVLRGRAASVAFGGGHAPLHTVRAIASGRRLRFAVPGRPAPLSFTGRMRGKVVGGSVRQGTVRGIFRLRRGHAPGLVATGLFRAGDGRMAAVVDDPFGPPRLVDLETGEVHALYRAGRAFAVGAGFQRRSPVQGTARFTLAGGSLPSGPLARVAAPALEVRFRSGVATLGGTLTLPPGPGPHPAAAFVSGSGPTVRAYLPDLQALLVRCGVGVLAYDKRGIGQSTGVYPGESPTHDTIHTLGGDAAAAVRFLAAQPEVDPARVGLAGHSQAGWIIPDAAAHEPAVKFAVVFAGPAVTAGENDTYQNLTGAGERPPPPPAQVDAEVERVGPSGVDPIPWIRELRIPVLWAYGGLDLTIPTRLSVRRLAPIAAEPGREFTLSVFPHANHALVETQTGLTSEMLRSDRFAPGLFPSVCAWLAARGITR